MAKKQVGNSKNNAASAGPNSATGAATAPAAKQAPVTKAPAAPSKKPAPRVTSAQHKSSENVSLSARPVDQAPVAVVEETIAVIEALEPAAEVSHQQVHLAIEKLAYGFWEQRGYQGGSPIEDWVRAEREYYTSRLSK